jgi:adenylate cyclase
LDTAQLAAIAGSSRVTRSFAFLDLCGFTDFGDAHGDEAAVTEVQHLRAAVREVTPLFGVRVAKWLGDGVMIVGVDNEPLVAAVVAIEQRFRHLGRLSVRAGIASGAVLLVDGDDYIGRAVNVAARLCDGAGAGELLAAKDGLCLPVWVDATREVVAEVRGLHEPVACVALEASPGSVEPHRGWSAAPLLSLVHLGRRAGRRA